MSELDNLKKRLAYRGVSQVDREYSTPTAARVNFNSSSQWVRMREDKLNSMKKALYNSYQAAVVQKYNAHEADDAQTAPKFRCLINHDKLKVSYQDKIISIPFKENTVEPIVDLPGVYTDNLNEVLDTHFYPGTVFKWLHGNKEEYVPDSYWIIYLQYSEETAYFRGQIRKADDQIVITPVGPDGELEDPVVYRGWMSGPNEKKIIWKNKQNVEWNDLNYSKLLYITRNDETVHYFKRFDRVIVNGQPWQVQAYNENYGSKGSQPDSGIMRVALKEAYTDTTEQIKQSQEAAVAADIVGPDVLAPYDEVIYTVNTTQTGTWSIVAPDGKNVSDLLSYKVMQDGSLKILITTTKSYKKGFIINYGTISKHVTIKSL